MTTNYVLASPTEHERLRLQARTWEPEAEAMLDQIGLQPGWRCLDMGCGAMGILGPLSRRVGADGQVIGIDTDAMQLAAVRDYVQREALANVEILEANIEQAGLPQGTFDFVHERLVFPHVAAPAALLQEMIALARPGGVIALQEGEQSSWNFYPTTASWLRLKGIIEAAFRLRTDITLAQRTYAMLCQAGLQDVNVRAAIVALRHGHPYMRLPVVLVTTLRPLIVRAKLATEMELDDLLAHMERTLQDPETIHLTFTMIQVWGAKRGTA